MARASIERTPARETAPAKLAADLGALLRVEIVLERPDGFGASRALVGAEAINRLVAPDAPPAGHAAEWLRLARAVAATADDVVKIAQAEGAKAREAQRPPPNHPAWFTKVLATTLQKPRAEIPALKPAERTSAEIAAGRREIAARDARAAAERAAMNVVARNRLLAERDAALAKASPPAVH